MNLRVILPIIVLIPFSILSVMAVWQDGLIGFYEVHSASLAGVQVFTDLVIACIVALTFIVPDARKRGLNPWIFVVMTLLLGSIGLLVYLLVSGLKSATEES